MATAINWPNSVFMRAPKTTFVAIVTLCKLLQQLRRTVQIRTDIHAYSSVVHGNQSIAIWITGIIGSARGRVAGSDNSGNIGAIDNAISVYVTFPWLQCQKESGNRNVGSAACLIKQRCHLRIFVCFARCHGFG